MTFDQSGRRLVPANISVKHGEGEEEVFDRPRFPLLIFHETSHYFIERSTQFIINQLELKQTNAGFDLSGLVQKMSREPNEKVK